MTAPTNNCAAGLSAYARGQLGLDPYPQQTAAPPAAPTDWTGWRAKAMELADNFGSASYNDGANSVFGDESVSARAALEAHLREVPMGEPVAHCSLTPSGKIEHFDGKPTVMVGPVGNPLHPVPLYRHPKESK